MRPDPAAQAKQRGVQWIQCLIKHCMADRRLKRLFMKNIEQIMDIVREPGGGRHIKCLIKHCIGFGASGGRMYGENTRLAEARP